MYGLIGPYALYRHLITNSITTFDLSDLKIFRYICRENPCNREEDLYSTCDEHQHITSLTKTSLQNFNINLLLKITVACESCWVLGKTVLVTLHVTWYSPPTVELILNCLWYCEPVLVPGTGVSNASPAREKLKVGAGLTSSFETRHVTRTWFLLVLSQRLTVEGTEFTSTESGSITAEKC